MKMENSSTRLIATHAEHARLPFCGAQNGGLATPNPADFFRMDKLCPGYEVPFPFPKQLKENGIEFS